MSEESTEPTPPTELTEEQKLERMGPPIPDRGEAELRQLAMDMVEGKVFGDWQIDDPSLIMSVFVPFALCSPKQLPSNIHGLFEYMSEAGPRSVNGYPMFMSMKILTVNDREAIVPMVKQYAELRQAFRGEASKGGDDNEPEPA